MSNKAYKSIFKSSFDAILLTDANAKILSANPSAEVLFGYSEEELIKFNVSQIVDIHDYQFDFKTLQGKISEITLLKNGGTKFIAEISINIFKDDNDEDKFTLIIKDCSRISLQKKIEKNLKDQTELLNLAHEAILVRGLDSKILFWNDGAKEMYGYNQDEAVNKVSHDLLQTKFPTSLLDLDQELINEKKWSGELIQTTKNGKQIVLSSRQSLKVDENGYPISFLEINNDISEQKIALMELKIYQENLEEKVVERTKALELSNNELQQFAYVASHDLREPLRMITSFLKLLEKQYNDKLDENGKELIGYAVNGAKRLDSMINDLLEYSRVVNKEREFKNVNFKNVLEQTKLNLKSSIDDTNAVVTYHSLPTLFGDEQLLVMLFQNLISNSIKYRSNKTPKIEISAIKESNRYLFKVEDNGIGMSNKNLKRIFTIFQRLHTKEEYEGTGIGLAIVKKIVNQHDGHIWVKSILGNGTTLYFTIPT
jgi:PAS domain S-box-containing protein